MCSKAGKTRNVGTMQCCTDRCDELSISEKVNLDVEYMKNKSFFFDIKIIFITLRKVIKTEGVAH